MSQGKSWTFTVFEYDEKSVALWEGKANGADLMCFQEEKAPDTGRLHIQGFIRFKTNFRLAGVKKFLNNQAAHLEIARGSPRQNFDYCSKDDTATGRFRFQHGVPEDFMQQGKRSDLDAVVDLIKSNKTLEEINAELPKQIIKFGRGIQLSRSLFLSAEAPAAFPRCVIVLWGRSGSGKSQWARQFALHRGLSLYSKNLTKASDVQWFDGYDGEQVLLLDDFTESAVSFRELLIWTDIYKHRVQVKGAMAIAKWNFVIITSNTNPDNWYLESHPGTLRDPLTRRLDYTCRAPETPHFCSDAFPINDEYKGRFPPADLGGRMDDEPQAEAKGDGMADMAAPAPGGHADAHLGLLPPEPGISPGPHRSPSFYDQDLDFTQQLPRFDDDVDWENDRM